MIALCSIACSFQAYAADNWVEVHSPHFTVATNAGDKQGIRIADQFERMRWVFQTLFRGANVDPPAPIVILALRDKKDFRQLEPESYLAKGQLELAGFFLRAPDKNYILVRLDNESEHPFSTVYHEYTHLLNSRAEGWMPLWLNEGLAEFFQNTDIRDKEVILGEPSIEDIIYLRQNRIIPLTELLKVDENSPYYHEEQKGTVFYAESWALTHFLEITDNTMHTHRLTDYTNRVHKGEDPVTAGREAFGDLDQLRDVLETYIAQAPYRQFVLPGKPADIDNKAFAVKPLSQPSADALRADFLAYIQRTGDAQALLDHVLSEEPGNALAHETKGYLALRQGDLKGARDWYEEAVKLDAQDFLAQYYYAAIAIALGDMKDPDRVESSLRAAIQLNPQFAPAYDRLATFYAIRQENLDEAHLLEVTAVGLEPENVRYRLNAATIQMEERHYANAENILKAALRLAKVPADKKAVETLLQDAEGYAAAPSAPGEIGNVTAIPAVALAQVPGGNSQQIVVVQNPPDEAPPRHAAEEPHGPLLTANGSIQNVQCSRASVLEFQLKGREREFRFFNDNYSKVDFAAMNFTPNGEIHPCRDLEGLHATVRYFATADKTVDGQVVSIELSK